MTLPTALPEKRTTQICDTCLKLGHSADRCWKTYPDLKPSPQTLALWRDKQSVPEQELPECTFCGKVGHLSVTCWKLHPELRPSKADFNARRELKKQKQQQSQNLEVEREPDARYHQGQGPLTTEALIWNPKLGVFDLGIEAETGWVLFQKGPRFWFDFLEYGPRRLPGRCIISLTLNEVGRRLKCGMVY